MSLHAAAAGLMRSPELALDPMEAKTLAQAVVDLERAFPTQVDPRALAVVNFVGVCGMVYVPKMMQINRRQKDARNASNANADKSGLPGPDFFDPGFTPEGGARN